MDFPAQAMILGAGQGTRLGELGRRQAKVLVEIGGEPLLAHHLRYLSALGVRRVVLNASHLAEQLNAFAASHPGPPDLKIVVEQEPLGTAGGVINALDHFTDGPLLVLYGDVITGADLRPMAALHLRDRPVATIAVHHSDHAEAKGALELSDASVRAFHEKNPAITSGWVNAGIYVVDPGWLAGFADGAPLDFGFDLFPAALAAGRELRAYRLSAPVLDVGTLPDLERARALGLPQVPSQD